MRTGGGCRTVDREISRFPRKELAMTRSDVLPSTICTVSAPKIGLFRGSMAGLCAPLSTLRRDPRGPRGLQHNLPKPTGIYLPCDVVLAVAANAALAGV